MKEEATTAPIITPIEGEDLSESPLEGAFVKAVESELSPKKKRGAMNKKLLTWTQDKSGSRWPQSWRSRRECNLEYDRSWSTTVGEDVPSYVPVYTVSELWVDKSTGDIGISKILDPPRSRGNNSPGSCKSVNFSSCMKHEHS
jgi:hypothetical protein